MTTSPSRAFCPFSYYVWGRLGCCHALVLYGSSLLAAFVFDNADFSGGNLGQHPYDSRRCFLLLWSAPQATDARRARQARRDRARDRTGSESRGSACGRHRHGLPSPTGLPVHTDFRLFFSGSSTPRARRRYRVRRRDASMAAVCSLEQQSMARRCTWGPGGAIGGEQECGAMSRRARGRVEACT